MRSKVARRLQALLSVTALRLSVIMRSGFARRLPALLSPTALPKSAGLRSRIARRFQALLSPTALRLSASMRSIIARRLQALLSPTALHLSARLRSIIARRLRYTARLKASLRGGVMIGIIQIALWFGVTRTRSKQTNQSKRGCRIQAQPNKKTVGAQNSVLLPQNKQTRRKSRRKTCDFLYFY